MSEFFQLVEELAERSRVAERQAVTEEATKTSVILPLLHAWGFDVFNLNEVVPEYVADVGTKKGEKVDFAVKIDGKIAMLVEAKPITSKLGDAQFNQLFRYFSVTEARLAILTNGREAWFFSDTDAPNKMDKKPFFKFDFQSHDSDQIEELSRFRKEKFAIDQILEAASALKHTRAASNYLKAQLENPDDEFVRLVGRQIYDGSITKNVAEQLKPAIQAALDELIRDRIQDKLSITFRNSGSPESKKPLDESDTVDSGNGVMTTEEEIEAHRIIRAIGAKVVDVNRIGIRDAKSYCAILMDDNNRRPICRLYFNSPTNKSVVIFDADKNEQKHKIASIEELYLHAEALEAVITAYGQ
ncbi:type I restriction endonuclease [Ruegeria sp. HKCCD8929]|uniref:type I restriction endonuclease n=1 Tax=Ruegeria sp. HKCCD8929 TaxID=2683006 RepID=UPI001487E41A|nr:type I restriction endonuclease [Ruegeria sp. HKCCD8929]